ncbi:CENP-B protein, partial [Zopfia rhizophila CBS 207.26]
VVTGSDRRQGRRKLIQPGNRDRVTVIEAINALGWALPSFIIFKSKRHINTWVRGQGLPHSWKIGLSNNGWTNNKLSWLKHFNEFTKDRTIGVYRLLIIDSHESHNSLEFQDICKERKIITLYMPSHSSHLVQPLDVGCFAPLKKAYGTQISELSRHRV